MSKLTELYTSLIDLCGIELANHGRLVYRSEDAGEILEIPLTYDGKPIVFPEKQHLDDPENKSGEVIILHPLSESFLRAPSEVQEVLRKAAIVRICEVGSSLLQRAININHAATMDSSIKLNHKLSGLFAADLDSAVDVKFTSWFNKLDLAMQQNSSSRLFNIFLKMHGEVGKNKFDRVAVISSPLYDELKLANDTTTIFGVTGGRKKDLATLTRILESLFPELANGGYISGSSSGTAPTLMAFMEALALIGDRFNTVLAIYGKEAKGIAGGNTRGVDFNRDVNLSSLRSMHPLEDYNMGVGKDSADKRDRPAATSTPPRVEPITHVETRNRPTPQSLEVPVRSVAPAAALVRPSTEEDDGVPSNAFWLSDGREERSSRRGNYRDEYDGRDSRYNDRGYRDERRDDRYPDRRSSRRDSYQDERDDRRGDRYDRRDSPRGRTDYRRERETENSRGEYGQFWEQRR